MKTIEHILAYVLVAMLLNGCMAIQSPAIAPGDVLPLQVRSTAWGILQAAQSKPGTAILTDGIHYLAAWPCAGCQGWSFVTADIEAFLGRYAGNIGQVRTFEEVQAKLVSLGWTAGTPAAMLATLGDKLVAVNSAPAVDNRQNTGG